MRSYLRHSIVFFAWISLCFYSNDYSRNVLLTSGVKLFLLGLLDFSSSQAACWSSRSQCYWLDFTIKEDKDICTLCQ